MSAYTFLHIEVSECQTSSAPRTRVAVGLRFYALEYLNFIDGSRVSRPVKQTHESGIRCSSFHCPHNAIFSKNMHPYRKPSDSAAT